MTTPNEKDSKVKPKTVMDDLVDCGPNGPDDAGVISAKVKPKDDGVTRDASGCVESTQSNYERRGLWGPREVEKVKPKSCDNCKHAGVHVGVEPCYSKCFEFSAWEADE